MATVDRTGVSSLDLAGYREYLEGLFRSAYGQDLVLDPETVQGQQIGIMAQSLTEESEALIAESNGTSWRHGAGRQLDDLGTLTDTEREAAAHSTVSATLTGLAGTVIPQRSRAETLAGDAFITDTTVTIDSSGSVDVTLTADEAGPVPAAAGALTRIVTLISGWDSITNAAAAALGATVESDEAYRERYPLLVSAWAQNSVPAMRSAILEAGATSAQIEENDTAAQVTRQGLDIAANSYMPLVRGGVTAAIAEAIADTKPPGIGTAGAVSQVVADGRTMRFQRVDEIPVALTVALTIDTNFPANGQANIQSALVAYALAQWQIGKTINVSRLYLPILTVLGHSIKTAPVVTIKQGGASLPAAPNLNVLYTLATANITVTTS